MREILFLCLMRLFVMVLVLEVSSTTKILSLSLLQIVGTAHPTLEITANSIELFIKFFKCGLQKEFSPHPALTN